jgi:NAD(P)-dependent dehydrogenase (short-subunit alcohol dehydrogenase family)
VYLDVTRHADWLAAVDTAGDSDGLVTCAGSRTICPIVEMSGDDIESTLAVNLLGPILGTTVVAGVWLAAGWPESIVNVASHNGWFRRLRTSRTMPPPRAALIAYTRAAAVELGPAGARVNAINARSR